MMMTMRKMNTIMVVNVIAVVLYVEACRLARTGGKNRQSPEVLILV